MSTAVQGQNTADRHYLYPPTGKRLTPVTTILDFTDAKQHILVPWSARLAAEFAVDNLAALHAVLTEGNDEGKRAVIDLIRAQDDPAEFAVSNLSTLLGLLAEGANGGRQVAVDVIKAQAERRRNLKREAGSHVHHVAEVPATRAATTCAKTVPTR